MKLIFIRHGEPDYEQDTLTENGFRQAEALSERVKNWKVSDCYCSPMNRAQKTAEPSLRALKKKAEIKPWLHEFNLVKAPDPDGGSPLVPWDRTPLYLNRNPDLLDRNKWKETEMVRGTGIAEYYDSTILEFDELLLRYGYKREGMIYRILPGAKKDAVAVLFCHLGISCVMLSHLINVSPFVLWQGTFPPPASVTIAGTEERDGEYAVFRIQVLGDTSQLREKGERASDFGSGSFTELFQE